MLRIEVYPVMSGISVTLHGVCTHEHGGIGRCQPITVRTDVTVESMERHGIDDAVWLRLQDLVREYGEVWGYATH